MINVFLKWAGGKRRIINEIDKKLPKKIDRYFEPFLGAGSVFFYVKEKYNPKYCLISDINKDLIDTYKAVRDDVDLLLKYLQDYKEKNSEDFYYSIRDDFNEHKVTSVKRAAVFVYLNRTCFNGLYRVNSKNRFNVPYGKNSLNFDEAVFKKASKLLKGVIIQHNDYRKIEKKIIADDFVYLDPCYDPIKKTSFTSYTPDKFKEENRDSLYEFIVDINKKGAKFLLSNNDIPDIKKLYKDFSISNIMVSRPINSVASDRGKIKELLIRNYN
jgi:DNA adenine methylase